MSKPNVNVIPYHLRDRASQAWNENDIRTFFSLASSDDYFQLFIDNYICLERGYNYELAFMTMYGGQKRGLGEFLDAKWIYKLLRKGNRECFRQAGDPLPEGEMCTIYRGAHALSQDAKRGVSWTSSLNMACWFATGFNSCYRDLVSEVYTTTVARRKVFAYLERESEFVIIPSQPKVEKVNLSLEEMRVLAKDRNKVAA